MTTNRLFKKIILFEYIGFGVVILVLWLNEILDVPAFLPGGHPTPINFTESLFETAVILLLSIFVIWATRDILCRIEHIAMYDPLTDLMNRRFLMEYLKHKVMKASRSKRPFSIILCDIDDFKKINDRFGHETGDFVLQQIANILKEITRPQDLTSRWGGEEFLIFLPDMSSGNAGDTAERLRERIDGHIFSFDEIEIKVTMSFGVSDHFYGDTGSAECIREADKNLYEAKRQGKNRVVKSAE
ncbi:MAG: GGDEF domain-containing protein [Desulfobacterales bacterium]|jgi:diguanylate cyclase (GGDEF)-like protein|nr:GGDEF domain-containing protein [Desulfobacterales bacterium]